MWETLTPAQQGQVIQAIMALCGFIALGYQQYQARQAINKTQETTEKVKQTTEAVKKTTDETKPVINAAAYTTQVVAGINADQVQMLETLQAYMQGQQSLTACMAERDYLRNQIAFVQSTPEGQAILDQFMERRRITRVETVK